MDFISKHVRGSQERGGNTVAMTIWTLDLGRTISTRVPCRYPWRVGVSHECMTVEVSWIYRNPEFGSGGGSARSLRSKRNPR